MLKDNKSEKFEIVPHSKVDIEPLLPVIQNLTSQGYNLSDIGMLLGFSGKDPKSWIWRLKENYPEIRQAIEAGKGLVNVELVKTAFKEAVGYWIDEEETEYKRFQKPNDPTKVEWIAIKKKKKPKYIQPNVILLWKLMCSRLPDLFQDTKKIEINKTSLEIKDATAEEIRRFAGKFSKIINAEFVETEKIETS